MENFSISKKKNRSFRKADRILLWEENAEDLENTIYIDVPAFHTADPSSLSISRSSPRRLTRALLLSIGSSDISSYNYIVLKKGTPQAVLNTLLSAKSHLDLLSELLSQTTSNQEAIDLASDYLKAPLFYFDASYRILAMTSNINLPHDPEWNHMKEKGFLSPRSIRLMQDSGDLDLLANQKEPFPYSASFYPFHSLVCNIWNQDLFYSRLNMLCLHDAPTELNRQECRILCNQLLRIARSSGESQSYTGPLNHMLLDLLRGMPLSEELITDRLQHLPQLRGSLIQVCCIEVNVPNDPRALNYYSSLIQRIFEQDYAASLEFEGRIVLILHARSEEALEPSYQKLHQLTVSQGLSCGISLVFDKFHALRIHSQQALFALTFCQNSSSSRNSAGNSGSDSAGSQISKSADNITDNSGNQSADQSSAASHSGKCQGQQVVFFSEIYFHYILSLLSPEQARAMISHKILQLLAMQPAYQFSLTDTLRVYLECSCNLQKTAQQLFIHKNTALYRLNHIKEILRTDLSSAEECMQLLFSFKIIEKYPIL